MAHMVEKMMYVGDAPWHKLGTKFDVAPTTEEAMRAGGLAWEVNMRSLFNEKDEVSTHRETFRADTGATLGVVGPRYHPLQNVDAFGVFDPLVKSGQLVYETAGSLDGGKKVWILAKAAGGPIVVKGNDIVERYALLSNAHDGTLAIRLGWTGVRVVCANTMAMAINSEDSQLIRIRHSGGAVKAMADLTDIMNVANATFEASAEQYRRLANSPINAADLRRLVKQVFSLTDVTEEGKVKVNEMMGEIVPLFERGRGNDMAEIRGTAWAAYNAISEHLQYFRKARSEENRLKSLWFGDSAAKNKQALIAALEIVADKAA